MIVAVWFELSISRRESFSKSRSGQLELDDPGRTVDMIARCPWVTSLTWYAPTVGHGWRKLTHAAKHSKQREQDWLVSLSKLYDTSKNVCFFSSNYHGLCLNVSRTRSEEHNCRHEIPSWWLTLEKEHDSSYSHTSLSNAEQCQEVGQRKTVTAPMAKFLSTSFFIPCCFSSL